jgi:plastocyanin
MNFKDLMRRIRIYGLCCLLLSSCTSAPEQTAPKVYKVEIKQMLFQPAILRVHKGDTVIFINEDFVNHNVTEESNKTWSSAPLSTGKSWRLKAIQSANYYCTIHPVMKGKLLVQ